MIGGLIPPGYRLGIYTMGDVPSTRSTQSDEAADDAAVKVLLRMPPSLHAAAKRKAAQEYRSLHMSILHAVELWTRGVTGD